MASNLSWNPVSVNFNDASSFMRNATDSISRAGTVFGELRKSILDEEQRRIENEFKQKQFDENVRQFGETLGFNYKQLGETNRHNIAQEGLEKTRNDITAQHYRWTHEDAQQRNKLSGAYTDELRRARIASTQAALAEKEEKEKNRRYMRLVSNWHTLTPEQQTAGLKQLSTLAEAGDSSAAYLIPQLTNVMKNPSGTPIEHSLRMANIAAGLSGNPEDIRNAAKDARDDWKVRKEREDAIRQQQIAADKATAAYLPTIHPGQRLDMEGNAALMKKGGATLFGPNHTYTINTGQIVKNLIDTGQTGTSWIGNGTVLEPDKTGGDLLFTDSLGLLHSDNQFNDPRFIRLREEFIKNFGIDGRELTPVQAEALRQWITEQRDLLYKKNQGTTALPDFDYDNLDF